MQVLERLDPDGKYLEGKRGACVAFVQLMVANDRSAPREKLGEVVSILRDCKDPSAQKIAQTITTWGTANGFLL
jgi:hypothetical protein